MRGRKARATTTIKGTTKRAAAAARERRMAGVVVVVIPYVAYMTTSHTHTTGSGTNEEVAISHHITSVSKISKATRRKRK